MTPITVPTPLKPVYDQVAEVLAKAETVFLCSHVSPDGDTLGSMLAFRFALEAKFPNIQTIHTAVSGNIASIYGFMPGVDQVVDSASSAHGLMNHYDVALAFDCGAVDRLGSSRTFFQNAKTSINVDHHVTNNRYGDVNIVEETDSASGQVVYRMLEQMDVAMSRSIAVNIYTAILTDTGGFRYSNTTPEILRIAAVLVDAGADPATIFKRVYDEAPYSQLMLQADMIQRIRFNDDHTVAWVEVRRLDIERHQAKDEHLEGLVEKIRSINTVKIAAVIKENNDTSTKISCRSDDEDINVAEVMGEFGGGGHKLAAGCLTAKSIDEMVALVIPMFEARVRARQNMSGAV